MYKFIGLRQLHINFFKSGGKLHLFYLLSAKRTEAVLLQQLPYLEEFYFLLKIFGINHV